MYDLRHYNHVRTNMAVLRANRAIWDSLIYIALGQLCHYNYNTDKYIEVADGHHVTAKKKGQVQIKM